MGQETVGVQSENGDKLFDDFLLSLNLGASFLFAGIIFVLKSASSQITISDSAYLALRSVFRVNDFLGLSSVNPVSTGTLRREIPGRVEHLGAEVTVLITGFAAMALFLLLLRLFTKARVSQKLLDFARLPLLLFAGPAVILLVFYWSWKWASYFDPEARGNFFRNNVLFLVFVTEFLCLSATVFRPGRQRASWATSVFAIFHWVFWGWIAWEQSATWLYPIYTRDFLLIFLPVSTLLWVCREKPLAQSMRGMICRYRKVLYALSCAAVLLGVAVWHPARNVDLSHPRDWKTVEVELSRGPCYGSCAVYTATVRGDGQVEFVGYERHSQTETRKSGKIAPEKVLEILQNLSRVEFTTLDGRAFLWAFDSPSIGVRASVDGKTKVVVSDTFNERSSVGRQTSFLAAAGEIDSILKSAEWTRCKGNCDDAAAKR